jgi:hypothetical protein
MNGMARLIAGIGAAVLAASIVSQGWLSVQGAIADGETLAVGVWRYLCYFTVLTNTLVAVVLARAALKPQDRAGLNAPRFELLAVTSILFVGAVYNVLLASQWDPQGLQKLNDDILHIWSPVGFALFWLMRGRGALSWRDAAFAASWPLIYSIYGLARGAFDGFYPYFFMNPETTPWPLVARNMMGLVLAFLLGALALVALDRAIGRFSRRNAKDAADGVAA